MFSKVFSDDILFVPTLIHILAGLVMGALTAVSYIASDTKKKTSGNFFMTLIILPAVISVVITMVGSNMAKAVSIAGVFALVRFRSVPGDSRDILFVFLSMATGLAVGMGCYPTGFALVVILGTIMILLERFEEKVFPLHKKVLKITVPENMNIQDAFDQVFQKYLQTYKLTIVKTINMGTLFQLTYEVKEKKDIDRKAFIDELRVLNGNLAIMLGDEEEGVNPVL